MTSSGSGTAWSLPCGMNRAGNRNFLLDSSRGMTPVESDLEDRRKFPAVSFIDNQKPAGCAVVPRPMPCPFAQPQPAAGGLGHNSWARHLRVDTNQRESRLP